MPIFRPFVSLTRFAIGGVIYSLDGLMRRIESAESQLPAEDLAHDSPTLVTAEYPEESLTSEPTPDARPIRDALVGLVFTGQDRLDQYVDLTDRATRVAGRWLSFLGDPIVNSRWLLPVRRRFDALEDRGQATVNHWRVRGRAETSRSVRLVEKIVNDRVNTAINYLAANAEVQELVQSQSAGLVDEVIEEARERSVSADYYLETLFRSIFRKPPRSSLTNSQRDVAIQENTTAKGSSHG